MASQAHFRLAFVVFVLWLAITGLSLTVYATESASSRCERHDFGTQIHWVDNKDTAFRLAREQRRPVMVLHLSGNFAKEEFT